MMKKEWIVYIPIILVLFWVGIKFNLNKEILIAIASIFVIGNELYDYYKTKVIIKTNHDAVFQFKNPRWVITLLAMLIFGFILIQIIETPVLQIINTLLFLLYAYFIARRESTEIFLIDQDGIQYLNKRKYIPQEKIIEIERNTDTIKIHTSEWWNHFNFKAKNLKAPRTFKELIDRIDDLPKSTETQSF